MIAILTASQIFPVLLSAVVAIVMLCFVLHCLLWRVPFLSYRLGEEDCFKSGEVRSVYTLRGDIKAIEVWNDEDDPHMTTLHTRDFALPKKGDKITAQYRPRQYRLLKTRCNWLVLCPRLPDFASA